MKYKTSELSGKLLDQAVILAMGMTSDDALNFGLGCPDWKDRFHPSSRWVYGGPIIEREKIRIYCVGEEEGWRAGCGMHSYTPEFLRNLGNQQSGQSPLIAAMRAFVQSKFGDEVEL